MKTLLRYFFRGLVFVVPVAATVYVVYALVIWLDNLVNAERWLGVSVPGLGAILAIVVITAIGFFASNFLTGWIVGLLDRLFSKIPGAKVIYSAIKDLLDAFVGEQKRFDRPVLVRLEPESGVEAIGFITRDEVEWLDRRDTVAVYFPQSYNFAGSLILVPTKSVTPINADSSAVMQFIVSGGVSKDDD